MVIDYSTALGRVRLRISDTSDIPYLPDSVILGSLTNNNNNENLAAKECSMYILGMMSGQTRQRLMQIETYGSDVFLQYQKYLMMIWKDPAFSTVSPIPYTGSVIGTPEKSKINTFVENIDKAYVHYNADETLQQIADINDMASSSDSGWTLV